jgi:two-component sensor histidine kinase
MGIGWLESVHPDERERCFLIRSQAFEIRQSFKMEYRLRRKDGEYRWILDTGIPHYTENNTFAGYIGSCFDITEHKQAQEQIQASLREKDVLLKEIYHRVKNNLQVISSLLNLQSEYIKDKDDLEIFQQSQMRIESMALIHQKLYQSQDLAKIDFSEYIRDLVASLFSSYEVNTNVISLTVNAERILLSLDAAIPCGLIITELVSNSLKYAFPKGKTGEIAIELYVENNLLNLKVQDNGIGLPPEFDLKNTTSLGLQLVDALTNQLSGEIQINYNSGVEVKIAFPMSEKNSNWRKK